MKMVKDIELLPQQIVPAGDWRLYELVIPFRGSGATMAGAYWLASRMQPGERYALVSNDKHEIRDIMIPRLIELVGALGAKWMPGNDGFSLGGVEFRFFLMDRPEYLRGPQFHGAWVHGNPPMQNGHPMTMYSLAEALSLALRLGERPQGLFTGHQPFFPKAISGPVTFEDNPMAAVRKRMLSP